MQHWADRIDSLRDDASINRRQVGQGNSPLFEPRQRGSIFVYAVEID
jgi:hypothetical protein